MLFQPHFMLGTGHRSIKVCNYRAADGPAGVLAVHRALNCRNVMVHLYKMWQTINAPFTCAAIVDKALSPHHTSMSGASRVVDSLCTQYGKKRTGCIPVGSEDLSEDDAHGLHRNGALPVNKTPRTTTAPQIHGQKPQNWQIQQQCQHRHEYQNQCKQRKRQYQHHQQRQQKA